MTYIDYKNKIEFTLEEYKEIDSIVKNNITWFASCWDHEAVKEMVSIDIKCFKIASASLTDHDLIREMLYNLPIILSTGMSTEKEIDETIQIINSRQIGLLHATSSYPCPPEELNLKNDKDTKTNYPHI